ncbi:poly(ethylene terephthalate) hydrolase family protein [Pseudomonas sp. BMS12]|uniref:poly(ethylene terephthalate) hydrolase family protein n=1 Tax=Pseudomonas sp. BMS12 TaxID=1796033 RepID=UPI00083B676C|nr:lipase [Pseudomonas sp. BMS12]
MFDFKLAGLAAALAFASGSAMAALPDTPGTAFPAVSSFDNSGPYATTSQAEGPNCRIYRPSTLGQNGVRHPIILWGNGTGATPDTYAALLKHWASHGFVVAAAETSDAGTGQEMLACLSYLVQANGSSYGTYAGKLNAGRVGTSGHSQGGGGSIMAGQDDRVRTTAPIQPYTLGLGHNSSSQSKQKGPMFLMSGGSDTIAFPYLNAQPVYNRINQPIFWGERRFVSHFEPVGDGGAYRGPATAWFRYQLMNDANAGSTFNGTFCSLCVSPLWTVKRKGF